MSRYGTNRLFERSITLKPGTREPTIALVDAVAIIVGLVIGTGIFETPALVAANVNSGMALLLTWVAGGVCESANRSLLAPSVFPFIPYFP